MRTYTTKKTKSTVKLNESELFDLKYMINMYK